MSNIVKFENVENRVLEIRGTKVILDSDLAELYGVETKRINEAVKNNPERFPDNYVKELTFDRTLMFRESSLILAKVSMMAMVV